MTDERGHFERGRQYRLTVEQYSIETDQWTECEIALSGADLERLMRSEVVISEGFDRRTITRVNWLCAVARAHPKS